MTLDWKEEYTFADIILKEDEIKHIYYMEIRIILSSWWKRRN